MIDVSRALVKLAHDEEAIGNILNIGSDREISINELARLVKRLTGSDSEIVRIPYDEAYEQGFEDMPRRIPSLSRIRAMIGYDPTFSITDIVSDVIAHCRERAHGEFGNAGLVFATAPLIT